MAYCNKCGNKILSEAKYCSVCGASTSIEEAPPLPEKLVVSNLKLAYWWERFVAWLIDAVIIGVVTGLLGFFVLVAGFALTWWSGWPVWIPFLNFNLGGVIYFLYWMFMDGTFGQSIGKMVMRIKVTRLNGSEIGMGKAALESLGKAFLLPLDCLLGWILYPRRRQRIFNYISETIVIKTT